MTPPGPTVSRRTPPRAAVGAEGRRAGSAPGSRLRVVPTVVAVAAFVVLMGWVSGEL